MRLTSLIGIYRNQYVMLALFMFLAFEFQRYVLIISGAVS